MHGGRMTAETSPLRRGRMCKPPVPRPSPVYYTAEADSAQAREPTKKARTDAGRLPRPGGVGAVGSRYTVRVLDSGEATELTQVAPEQVALRHGRISTRSPVDRARMGSRS